MKTFPQELVDKVIDELYFLVQQHCFSNPLAPNFDYWRQYRISRYSTVSKAWVIRTQKYHFSSVYFDDPATLETWRTRIAADPAGVSRHVCELVVCSVEPSELEDLREHLNAFVGIKSLALYNCNNVLQFPFIRGWFGSVGSRLTELRLSGLVAPQHTIVSLVAGLPLLRILDMFDLDFTEDADKMNPPTPPRIPFFDGTNFFISTVTPLDWVPPSARFGRLTLDTPYLEESDLVNQWFTSSSTTLTDLGFIWVSNGVSCP